MRSKNVVLGKNATVEEFSVIGELPPKAHEDLELRIGDNALIRSGTVIYAGTVIGNNFRTGHGVTIREENLIGDNVSVGVYTYLGPGNRIGNDVNIHTGCFIESASLADRVVLGPHVVFTNDLHPRCPRYNECVGGARVEEAARIGAGVTILPGIRIGANSLVGAGSVVTRDVPPKAVVVGNPAILLKSVEDLVCLKGFYKKPYEWCSEE